MDGVGTPHAETARPAEHIVVDEYRAIIRRMKSEFASDVFAVKKDKGFESAVSQIYHAFTDGNKRIAAACFLYLPLPAASVKRHAQSRTV